MPSITDRLPTELIVLVCRAVGALSSGSLLHLLLTSRTIYEIAYPLLFNNARVKSYDSPDSPLLLFSNRVQSYARHVQSLNILFTAEHLHVLFYKRSDSTSLEPMIAQLPALINLTIFILQLDHRELCILGKRPHGVVDSLLRKLPKSVRHFEVVTNGLRKNRPDRGPPWPCFCHAIADRLQQLHHVRLRKGQLCMNMFRSLEAATTRKMAGEHVQPWPLRSLTVRLDLDAEYCLEPSAMRYCEKRNVRMSASALVGPLRAALDAGLLPNFQRGTVISRLGHLALLYWSRRPIVTRADLEATLFTVRGTNHSGFAVYDVLHHSHTLVPVLAMETDYESTTDLDREDFAKWGDLFLVRDEEGEDHFGSYAEVDVALEGGCSFRQVVEMDGELLPGPDLTVLPGRAKTALPEHVRMALWHREETTGQKLLMAQRSEGFDPPPESLPELLPAGWRYGGELNERHERVIEVA